MDFTVLNKLDDDTLKALRANIDLVLASRFDTRLAVGRICTFVGKDGIKRELRIEKINGVTVSATETSNSAKPGLKWRVTKSLVNVTPIRINKPVAPAIKAPITPAAYGDAASW